MTRRINDHFLTSPLLSATVLALVLLATMQYYWVGQISAGERERRAASLNQSVKHFSEDFNRELARAYLSFQMDAATLRDKDWTRYAQRYERWFATAPFPGLVKSVYLVEVNQIGYVSLSGFQPKTRRFDQMAWPYELLPLRGSFERTYQQIFAEGDKLRAVVDPIDHETPAVLVPVARPWLLSDQQDLGIDADLLFSDLLFPGTFNRCTRCPPELYNTPLLAHTIVVLNREYITNTLLPALAERYFPSTGGLIYNLAVFDQDAPDKLIFSSDPNFDIANWRSPDATIELFDITYDDLNALLLANDLSTENDENLSGDRIAIGVLGRRDESISNETGQASTGHWKLAIKHREGSLDIAIVNLQRRNLLISFGTLLLLGVSMAMMMVTTRRAQRLARQQIDFASAVSHELRTPLAVICSAGENLADGVVHDPHKARQYGAVIYNEGRRLTEMVEQVLAFAGAQSGKQRYELQPTSIVEVIDSVLHALQHQLREGGFSVDLQLGTDLPPVEADAIALRRTIQNLVSNAMKYSGAERWIGVGVDIVAGERGSELRIRISDRGIGVDPGDIPHIFEPFYRGRMANGVQAYGSGLGLSLVKHTVDAHGGRIIVESQPGKGSCFVIYLPIPMRPSLAQQPAI